MKITVMQNWDSHS